MNDEMKVRSFRISDGVAEKFKAFCSEFDNQNAALDSLITAYEVQNAKAKNLRLFAANLTIRMLHWTA